VEEGTLDDGVLTLATTTLGRTATAKDVRSVRRTLALRGDLLVYDLWMAYAHVPDTHHLHAELRRTG
jgi:acetoacetate decarboxylase